MNRPTGGVSTPPATLTPETPMRILEALCLLAIFTLPLAGQATGPRWLVQLGATGDTFWGASRDTATVPGEEIEVLPASRTGFHAGLSRRSGAWEIGVEAGYSSGPLRARTDALILDDRTGDVTRYRLGAVLGRRLVALGPAALLLVAGVGLDHWEADGIGGRSTLAGRGGLALQVPLGGAVELENRILLGIGPSPFRKEDIPPTAHRQSLRTLSLGAGLRIGL